MRVHGSCWVLALVVGCDGGLMRAEGGDDAGSRSSASDAGAPVSPPPSGGTPCGTIPGSEFEPRFHCGSGTLCGPDETCVAIDACAEVRCDDEGYCSAEPCDMPDPGPEPRPDAGGVDAGTIYMPPPPDPGPTAPRLLVRLNWDERSDMDLHLLSPAATRWGNAQDCHYANCEGTPLPWGGPTGGDDPVLDRDGLSVSPERTIIAHPAPGVYRVGIDAFDLRTSTVRVHIECGHAPRSADFGPIDMGQDGDHRFWRVADVQIEADGSCTINPLAGRARTREFDHR
jgi:hypothetical protein